MERGKEGERECAIEWEYKVSCLFKFWWSDICIGWLTIKKSCAPKIMNNIVYAPGFLFFVFTDDREIRIWYFRQNRKVSPLLSINSMWTTLGRYAKCYSAQLHSLMFLTMASVTFWLEPIELILWDENWFAFFFPWFDQRTLLDIILIKNDIINILIDIISILIHPHVKKKKIQY